jgi:hypothetical protein
MLKIQGASFIFPHPPSKIVHNHSDEYKLVPHIFNSLCSSSKDIGPTLTKIPVKVSWITFKFASPGLEAEFNTWSSETQ